MTRRGRGNAEGIWGGSAPPGSPLDTGFRRYDGEGFGAASAGGDGGVRVPLQRDGRFAKGPYDGVLGVSGTATVLRGGVAPPGAPLDSCLRRNDARIGRGNAEGIWGGRAPPGAPLDTGFRRYDGEGFVAASAGGDGGVRVRLRRDGPFSKGPYDGVLGVSGWRPWMVVKGPLRVASGQASRGSGRADSRSGPAHWVSVWGSATVGWLI